METCTHVFQISGIKTQDKKRVLLQGIQQLGGKYLGGSWYKHSSTHLIIPQVLSSEKFLAACAAGKWVLTPNYITDSVKNGSWLPEGPYEVAMSTKSSTSFYPVRKWREKVINGRIKGAFQGWRVLLMVQEPTRRAMFERLLKAGQAEVYDTVPSHTSITQVMAKPVTENAKSLNAPCYPVSFIVHHLFGDNCVNLNFNIPDLEDTKDCLLSNFSSLETELKNFVTNMNVRPRLSFLGFLGYDDPYRPQLQAKATSFSNVGSMIECGLFIEALESIRSETFSGLLPPAKHLISLVEYAQQGTATSRFVSNFQLVMDNLLNTNPPWSAPSAVTKYYTQVLQCPRCKTGTWPFLQTAIGYCLSVDTTCHPLPGPDLPTLIHFYCYILGLCLKLFHGELHALTSSDLVLLQETPAISTPGSLLYGTFWTVWERTTLLSRAVKQLLHLLLQATIRDHAVEQEKQKPRLVDTLLDMLSVLVEFWFQKHYKLNQSLVENGLNDLAEHFAFISRDLSPAVLVELVSRVRSTRLKLVMADAIFRSLCSRNGFSMGTEPISLKKIVLSYLPALNSLAVTPCLTRLGAGSISRTCRSWSPLVSETSSEKENTPRGLNRVSAAGETLLHRASKKNQVETVLQILALPETDINGKDYAGWTPLHEACNHGSSECVKALLHHHPAPVLSTQVDGVSPLHDALLNGHINIAKMLLEHAGSVLLRQTDGEGRVPLDLICSPAQREELLLSAKVGDETLKKKADKITNFPLLEAGSCLLGQLVFSYQLERGLPGHTQSCNKLHSLSCKLVRALETHSGLQVTLDWTDQRAKRLVEDVEMLLELNREKYQEQVSLAVKECKGENTRFLMETLEKLKFQGEILLMACDKSPNNLNHVNVNRMFHKQGLAL